MMKINLENPNPALISIIENPEQIITLDANFLIAPDRRPITKRGIRFEQFTEIWLDPIFSAFPKLAIHEAVYDELVGISPQNYVEAKKDNDPPEIIIHMDSSLNEVEKVLRDAIETRISSHTKYEPLLDNKDDRGEVKSLSYIAVKGLLYFAANDRLDTRWIKIYAKNRGIFEIWPLLSIFEVDCWRTNSNIHRRQ